MNRALIPPGRAQLVRGCSRTIRRLKVIRQILTNSATTQVNSTNGGTIAANAIGSAFPRGVFPPDDLVDRIRRAGW